MRRLFFNIVEISVLWPLILTTDSSYKETKKKLNEVIDEIYIETIVNPVFGHDNYLMDKEFLERIQKYEYLIKVTELRKLYNSYT